MKKKNIIKLSVTAIILIALACWINSRWNAWFGNPPEAAYSPLREPGRILLTFGDENPLSRNISWQYDSIVYPSHVELADTFSKDTLHIDATGEVFQSRSGKAAYYVARLRSLKPSHSYSYRVCSNGKYSPWYHFQTHNLPTQDSYSFLYVGDRPTYIFRSNEGTRRHCHCLFLASFIGLLLLIAVCHFKIIICRKQCGLRLVDNLLSSALSWNRCRRFTPMHAVCTIAIFFKIRTIIHSIRA